MLFNKLNDFFVLSKINCYPPFVDTQGNFLCASVLAAKSFIDAIDGKVFFRKKNRRINRRNFLNLLYFLFPLFFPFSR